MKRYYKRWVDIFGDADFEELCRIAKKYMKVTYGGKPGICCWYGFYLYGTKEQLENLETAWKATGAKIYNRKPKGAWSITETKISSSDSTE